MTQRSLDDTNESSLGRWEEFFTKTPRVGKWYFLSKPDAWSFTTYSHLFDPRSNLKLPWTQMRPDQMNGHPLYPRPGSERPRTLKTNGLQKSFDWDFEISPILSGVFFNKIKEIFLKKALCFCFVVKKSRILGIKPCLRYTFIWTMEV